MKDQLSQSVTRDDIKLLLAVITVVVAGTFAWADIKNDTKIAVKEAASAKEAVKEIADKQNAMSIDQNTMALDVREIKTILKQQGLSAKAPLKATLAASAVTVTPKPTPTQKPSEAPQLIVNNVQPTHTPEATPTPVSEPSPTAGPSATPTPTRTHLLCVIGVCL